MSNISYNIEKQHEKGKLHAIERINALCDKGTFTEIYSDKILYWGEETSTEEKEETEQPTLCPFKI